MNKTQLIDAVAAKTDLPKATAKAALEAVTESITEALNNKEDGKVALVGFGSFSISARAARTGRNPQTGKEIQIAAKNVVKFKAGSELTNTVN